MKTAFQATRLAIAAFLIPYIFALNPAMLFIDTTVIEVIQVIITSSMGISMSGIYSRGIPVREAEPNTTTPRMRVMIDMGRRRTN